MAAQSISDQNSSKELVQIEGKYYLFDPKTEEALKFSEKLFKKIQEIKAAQKKQSLPSIKNKENEKKREIVKLANSSTLKLPSISQKN